MADRSEIVSAVATAYDFANAHLELSNCYYGKPHWGGPFVSHPFAYYFFLAGFVAQLRFTRILEIGTHFGGSIFSMAKGIEYAGMSELAEVVTVDIKDNNSEAFLSSKLVKRILGNCLTEKVSQQVTESFTGPVDLLFLDAVHHYDHTKRCLDQYLGLVSPRLIILDDIRLNTSMKALWNDLTSTFGDRAIDITDFSRRETESGFGLLLCEM